MSGCFFLTDMVTSYFQSLLFSNDRFHRSAFAAIWLGAIPTKMYATRPRWNHSITNGSIDDGRALRRIYQEVFVPSGLLG